MPERLVLLSAHNAANELADLQGRYRVSGVLPPHLAVADLDDSDAELVGRRPGVQVLSDPAQPLPSWLSDIEQLFVQAWRQRQQMIHKQRPGEGLAWDAEGFSPPDLPP
ncbi:MAG: hypothetical protein V7631_1181 [Massilia sp.]|jgi:hypothetical protein